MVFNVIPPAAQRASPLDIFGNFTPTVQGLLEFSLFSAYVSQSLAGSYNPPLWTMFYEFLGSFMVFATVAILRPLHLRTCCWDYFLQFLQSTSRFLRFSLREFSLPICSEELKTKNLATLPVQFCAQ